MLPNFSLEALRVNDFWAFVSDAPVVSASGDPVVRGVMAPAAGWTTVPGAVWVCPVVSALPFVLALVDGVWECPEGDGAWECPVREVADRGAGVEVTEALAFL